ncbi:hypothetical protein XA68_11767 [Ophiocordyceps unilateralis]|uniref:tRNA-splicing endonuclease subunit Sen15 domain-containing protein n=1 Tax=Ophiocordyceps unilateralis TaxID=268505 RepID=A0A2A9P223_OPHUN|nr:hypothetical protein XA68_11767 [Ophiocordyceps unilateralis]
MDSRLAVRRCAFKNATRTVLYDLEHQHDWIDLKIIDNLDRSRPLIRGLPPKRLYLHPDDQLKALASERRTGQNFASKPELEWVLPLHLAEKWSLASFATVFDSIDKEADGMAKRILLAILHNDSTVVYYFMHRGIVKPRQN